MSNGITVAGIGGFPSVSSGQLNIPYSLALDSANTMYITDFANNRVQKWAVSDTQATTVAGQASGVTGTGPNVLFHTTGVVIDEDDNIYMSDAGNNRAQFWANGASTGTTIAGTGSLIIKLILIIKMCFYRAEKYPSDNIF
jgi:sugar lactone lactonase YvrE